MGAQYPSFCTPEQYAAMTGTPVDPNIQPMLDAASSTIRRYCGWHIAPVVTENVTEDGSGGRIQSLPTLHLIDLLAVSETSASGVVTMWSPSDIEWSRDGYLRYRSRMWTDVLQGIDALIKHGWDFDDVANLTYMCATIVARAAASPFGEVQQAVGSVSVTFASPSGGASGGIALFPDQMAQLDAYKLNQRP